MNESKDFQEPWSFNGVVTEKLTDLKAYSTDHEQTARSGRLIVVYTNRKDKHKAATRLKVKKQSIYIHFTCERRYWKKSQNKITHGLSSHPKYRFLLNIFLIKTPIKCSIISNFCATFLYDFPKKSLNISELS